MNIHEPTKLPEFLYRYRSITDETANREIRNIRDRTVYGSAFKKMNDPMEGVYAFYKENFQTPLSDVLELISQDKSRRRICAFSEEYDNDLMWAHYAGQSQGICIRYDTEELARAVPNMDVFLVKVAYRKHPALIRQHNDEAIVKILSQKSLKWANEKEWRVLFNAPLGHPSQAGHPLSIGNAISRVYIGNRVKEQHEKEIISGIRTVNPKASFCKMQIEGYAMHFPPLNQIAT